MGHFVQEKAMSESVIDLKSHWSQSRENISKFQKSLRHWQTWEAEYEGLREDISELGDEPTRAQLKEAGDGFEGELLNQKEISLLLEDARGQARSSQQILGLLSRRIEYVQNIINSVKSLLQEAETNAAASTAISQEVCNDEGLPLAEIREDLDEEGNIISSSITSSSDAAPLVVETLRQSGVEILSKSKPEEKDAASITDDGTMSKKPKDVAGQGSDALSGDATDNLEPAVPKALITPAFHRKKSVTFAEGTKEGDGTTPKKRSAGYRERKAKMTYLRNLLRPGLLAEELAKNMNGEMKRPSSQNPPNFDQRMAKETEARSKGYPQDHYDSKPPPSKASLTTENTEAKRTKRDSNVGTFSAVIPTDETPEQAALRREMIEYQTADTGIVVAEIDLDEGDDSNIYGMGDEDAEAWTDEEEDEEVDYSGAEEDEDDDDDDEDEDQYGRAKRQVVSDKYRHEMLALEEKLNAKSMPKIEPKSNQTTTPPSVKPSSAEPVSVSVSKDIPPPPLARKASSSPPTNFAADIQIHSTTTTTISPISPQTPPSPLPPAGITSSTIIERPYIPSSSPNTKEEDPLLTHQQLKIEYHNLRKRMIYRQGGFLAPASASDDEEEDEKMDEREDGLEEGNRQQQQQQQYPRQQQQQQQELRNTIISNHDGEPNNPDPHRQLELEPKKISRFLAARIRNRN